MQEKSDPGETKPPEHETETPEGETLEGFSETIASANGAPPWPPGIPPLDDPEPPGESEQTDEEKAAQKVEEVRNAITAGQIRGYIDHAGIPVVELAYWEMALKMRVMGKQSVKVESKIRKEVERLRGINPGVRITMVDLPDTIITRKNEGKCRVMRNGTLMPI